MKDVRIPKELRVHFIPVQPAYDTIDWMMCSEFIGDPVTERRPEDAGKYNSNNGILVVYDEVGDPFVVPYRVLERQGFSDDQVHKLLIDMGFVRSCVYVPHSNDGGAFICKMFPEAYDHKTIRAEDDWLMTSQEEK